ncbi:C-reactive protein 1.4-like [Limulus polyphemus]|uniref:Pentraxin family member n=1 Tax=Limulus polyphemus TaxID=6850 RepID=A0ABM1C0D3_LIMPO|nr:C-reactive protein 1.4-like [Limulus polyphemus]
MTFLQLLVLSCVSGVLVSSMTTPRKGHLATKVRFSHPDSSIPRLNMIGTLPTVREMTLAFWVKLHQFDEYSNTVFSYAHPSDDNELAIWFEIKEVPHIAIQIHSGEGHHGYIPCPKIVARQWQHITLTWSTQSGTTNAYLNGHQCTNTTITISRGLELRSGGLVVLGADQDSVGGGFVVKETLEGELTDLHMWDEALDEEQISIIPSSTCTEGDLEFHGNLIDWSRSAFRAFDGVSFHPTTLCLRQ